MVGYLPFATSTYAFSQSEKAIRCAFWCTPTDEQEAESTNFMTFSEVLDFLEHQIQIQQNPL
jgi:hypothetical protein